VRIFDPLSFDSFISNTVGVASQSSVNAPSASATTPPPKVSKLKKFEGFLKKVAQSPAAKTVGKVALGAAKLAPLALIL